MGDFNDLADSPGYGEMDAGSLNGEPTATGLVGLAMKADADAFGLPLNNLVTVGCRS